MKMCEMFNTPFWTDGIGLVFIVFGVIAPVMVLCMAISWAVILGVPYLLFKVVTGA